MRCTAPTKRLLAEFDVHEHADDVVPAWLPVVREATDDEERTRARLAR